MTSENVEYYDIFADDYPLFFDDLAASMEEEGRWIGGVLERYGVRTVLDASCGAGRQAIPLALRGFQVTATDPCGAMLENARRTASQSDVAIQFHQARFTDLPALVDERFDAVITFGNGLCHQGSREEIVASLQTLRACCRPDGLSLIGIKDFDAVCRERRQFHGYRTETRAGEQRILFQLWEFEDPILVCGAFCLSGHDDTWTVRHARTREFMLRAAEVDANAREAGFTTVERLDHPGEAVYLLT